MKKIVELYKGLLPAFGLTPDEVNKIWVGGGELGKLVPLSIDEKNIFLPTEEFLKNSDYRDQIAFHPLIENSLKQPSQMLVTLQQALTTHLYIASNTIIQAMLTACIKQKNGEDISSPRLLKYLAGNEGADEKTKTFFKGLLEIIEKDSSKKIFSVYLKFGGKVNGVEVARSCSITSPLLEALERAQAIGTAKTGPTSVWNVEAPRKKDIELLINVIKSSFPLLEEKGYTKGSVNKIAPYCEALFDATLTINRDIVEISKALAKQDPVNSLADYLLVDVTPIEELLATTSEWDMYRNTIMKTAYNEGTGWNTSRSNAGVADEYKVVKETVDDVPEDPVAITKTLIVNSVKRVPGTRQPLVTLPEEERASMEHSTIRPSARREINKGYDRNESKGSGRFSNGRGYRNENPRDLSYNELADAIDDLKDHIRDIDRNGSRSEREGIRSLERDLDDLIEERRTRDRRNDDRYDNRNDSRREERRPVPRVTEERRYGNRNEERYEKKRFSNRNW